MDIIIYLAGYVLVIIGILLFRASTDKQIKVKTCIAYGITLIVLAIIIQYCIIRVAKKPNAIDVYKGKTELSIKETYKNGALIKSDTIVVYKKLFR